MARLLSQVIFSILLLIEVNCNLEFLLLFLAQYSFAKEKFADQNLEDVRVLTIDQVQGLQAPVVIFDTVRTKSPGFMAGHTPERYGCRQNGRVVVAMTRARSFRIVIGNVSKMGAESDMTYLANIHRTNANGAYFLE